MVKFVDDFVFVVVIVGVYGVWGECKVKSFIGELEVVFGYGFFLDGVGKVLFMFKCWCVVKDVFVVVFKELMIWEQVQFVCGIKFFVLCEVLFMLDEDEFYYFDLFGLKVQFLDGFFMGWIKVIYDFGGGDFLEIVDMLDCKGVWMIFFMIEQVFYVFIMDCLVMIVFFEEVEGDKEWDVEDGGE